MIADHHCHNYCCHYWCVHWCQYHCSFCICSDILIFNPISIYLLTEDSPLILTALIRTLNCCMPFLFHPLNFLLSLSIFVYFGHVSFLSIFVLVLLNFTESLALFSINRTHTISSDSVNIIYIPMAYTLYH